MPIYEYRCPDCKRRVSIFFRSFSAAESGAGSAACPHCGSQHLQRLVSKVSFIRSGNLGDSPPPEAGSDFDGADDYGGGGGEYGGADDDLGGLGAGMPDLDDEDPRTVARWARQMQRQSGEDLGPEFNTALTRIEAGEDPDRVMDDMEPPDGAADGDDGGMDDADFD